jgi:hypothetical protein
MIMQMKNIAAVICLVLGLISCKTENKYPIVGTWGELKLRTYVQSYTGIITGDTTYVGPAFSHDDYAQFNINGTGIIQLYHHYYPSTVEGLTNTENDTPTITKYNFGAVGSKYVLNAQSAIIFPSGFTTTDTVSLTNYGALIIHSVFDNHQFYIISDAYYAKEGIEPL